MNKKNQTILAILLPIALVALFVGGWNAGWWLTAKNVNKSAHINRQNYEAQKTYRDHIQVVMTNIATIDVEVTQPENAPSVDALKAQRVALVNEVCQYATNLTSSDVNPSEKTFITTNCPEGTLP